MKLCTKEELVQSAIFLFYTNVCVFVQNCLHSVLEHIAAYGQAVSRLQKFIDEVTGHSAEPCPPGLNSSSSSSSKKSSDPPFRTYQAFVWALYKYFTSFKEELNTIEKDIIAKGRFFFGPAL